MKKTILAAILGVFGVFAAAHMPHASARTDAGERASTGFSTASTVQAPALSPSVSIELPEQYIVAAPPVRHAAAKHVETDSEHVARLMAAPMQCGRTMPTDSDMWIGAAYCTVGK